MTYKSTRGNFSTDSRHAVLQGIAPDGGLFTSPEITDIHFDWKRCITLPTEQMATEILKALLPDFSEMEKLVEKAYHGKFEPEDLTPLVQVGENWILELFRGPTSAFKDVALSMLPQLITAARKQTGCSDRIVILTATSGDTGKAALEGFHNVEGTQIIVFYPYGGVSEIQKAQMTTQEGENVKVCAVRGNFDDCQRGVKQAFGEISKKIQGTGKTLSSANSINIGRLAPQVVYYFSAYRDLLKAGRIGMGDKVDYVVPTGNFGDILAGFYAKLMGLPVGMLICAANVNNVLTEFIRTGKYNRNRPFYKTDSPSMDILVSSNLERLLYLACGKNTEKVSKWMQSLSTSGEFEVDSETLCYIQRSFGTWYCTQEETTEEIRDCWEKNHYLIDPHTAVAWHAARRLRESGKSSNPTVVLSTASPYKFPQAVLKALGTQTDGNGFKMIRTLHSITGIPVPSNLSALENKQEKFTDVINADEIVSYVLKELEQWK
ncbi:MAG: threonine synthase [Sphaerochaetaceae bacterium]|nr:threonine synthase [Sphaerochaetaceae bacterium]